MLDAIRLHHRQTPSSMPAVRTAAQANARLAQSCTECRRRKKPCEGDIPGCVSCTRRGTVALCRYGDHRDDATTADERRTPATTVYNDDGLNNVDDTQSPPLQTSMPSWRARLSTQRAQLPHRWQADRLIELHRTYLAFGGAMLLPDAHLTQLAYGDGNDVSMPDVFHVDGCVLSLMLMICASSVKLLPASLTVAIVTSSGAANADVWTRFAVEFYEHGDLYGLPRLEVVAGLALYEINLVSVGNRASMIHRLDDGIRISRMLGLDRLGSADDDQARWSAAAAAGIGASPSQSIPLPTELAKVPLSASAAGDWAAKTYAQRDHSQREIARSLWYILLTRDWNAGPQTGGTFSVYPGSYTTKPPKLLLRRTRTHAPVCACRRNEDEVDQDDLNEADVWYFHYEAADCFRRYHELYAEAASRNEEVQYADVMALDAHMVRLLDQRPRWTRPESGTSRWRFQFDTHVAIEQQQRCSERICIVAPYVPQQYKDNNTALCCSAIELLSSTLWHKSFIIHRPFLARSLTEPSIYGTSQQKTLHGALQLIEVNNHYHEALNSTVLLFRLQHAAVALITMLLLQGALSAPFAFGSSDTLRIHKGLDFVIRLFKEHEGTFGGNRRAADNQTGVFEGIAVALDRLLTAATRLISETRLSSTRRAPRPSANAVWPQAATQLQNMELPTPAASSPSTTAQPMSSNTLNHLDKELFRLMSGIHNPDMAAAAFTSTDYGVAAQQQSIAPERPPWVSSELWQSIFDTLNGWNGDES